MLPIISKTYNFYCFTYKVSSLTMINISHPFISSSDIPKIFLFGNKEEEFAVQHTCILKDVEYLSQKRIEKKILNDLHFDHMEQVRYFFVKISFYLLQIFFFFF